MTNRTDIQQKMALKVHHANAIATILYVQETKETKSFGIVAETNLNTRQSDGVKILINTTIDRWANIFSADHDKNLAFAYCRIIKKHGYESSDHLYDYILERLQFHARPTD